MFAKKYKGFAVKVICAAAALLLLASSLLPFFAGAFTYYSTSGVPELTDGRLVFSCSDRRVSLNAVLHGNTEFYAGDVRVPSCDVRLYVRAVRSDDGFDILPSDGELDAMNDGFDTDEGVMLFELFTPRANFRYTNQSGNNQTVSWIYTRTSRRSGPSRTASGPTTAAPISSTPPPAVAPRQRRISG